MMITLTGFDPGQLPVQCDQIYRTFATLVFLKKKLGYIFEGVLCIWQNFEPSLNKFDAIGQIFIIEYGQILDKQSSHPVTLSRSQLIMTHPRIEQHQLVNQQQSINVF